MLNYLLSRKIFGSSGWYAHHMHAEVATIDAIKVATVAILTNIFLFIFFTS
jgi:hypothetical protein